MAVRKKSKTAKGKTAKKKTAKNKTAKGRTTRKQTRRSKAKADVGRVRSMAAKMTEMPLGLNPPLLGARTRIWKQDPSVGSIGVRDAYIHTQIESGPKDSQLEVVGLPPVFADSNGDFLIESTRSEALDAVHTYTVVRQVVTLYQRLLERRLGWQWNSSSNSDRLSISPRAGEGANAFYSRNDKALRFFFFNPPGRGADEMVFTCRSLDIVAHEAGHAILDSLQPRWITSRQPQTGGLHESFGDLTAVFTVLSQLDQVEFIIAETKADLHQPNVLSAVAEQFGSALGRDNGLRNADNDLRLSDVQSEVHAISKVFTGAVYDVLADAFTAARDSRTVDDAVVLYEVGRRIATLTVQAIIASPASNATYRDVAEQMIAIAEGDPTRYPDYASFIRRQFGRRQVLGAAKIAGPSVPAGFAASRNGCCGTMQSSEFMPSSSQ